MHVESLGVCACKCSCLWKQEDGVGFHGGGVTGVGTETKLKSSGLAVSVLNY